MMKRIWAILGGHLESWMIAGDRRWHDDKRRFDPGAPPTIELLGTSRPWFRCLACSRAWSPEPSVLGKMPKDWWQCPAGCNVPPPNDPSPALNVVSPAHS